MEVDGYDEGKKEVSISRLDGEVLVITYENQ